MDIFGLVQAVRAGEGKQNEKQDVHRVEKPLQRTEKEDLRFISKAQIEERQTG